MAVWLKPGKAFNTTWQHHGETIASIGVTVEAEQLRLRYRANIDGEWQDMAYPVALAKTDCHYGGQRYWFICPHCHRRAALLYCYTGLFLCRQCNGMAYRVQREQGYNRAIRKAEKLRKKLNWQAGIGNGEGHKPKGMHQRTFERLQDETYHYTVQGMNGMMAKFDKFMRRLEDS